MRKAKAPDTPEELCYLMALKIIGQSERIHSRDLMFELNEQGIPMKIGELVVYGLLMEDEQRARIEDGGYWTLIKTDSAAD